MAKHRTGYLYKRGKDGQQYPASSRKRGTFYIQYRVGGKTVRQSLKTSNRQEAEGKRLEIMAPFLVADEEQAIQATVHRLEATTERREALEDERHPPLSIADAWEAYEVAPNRPQAGPGTLGHYAGQWSRFERWMSENHPDRPLLRDVGSNVTEEYAKDLTRARYSAGTFNKHLRLLELVFRVLEDQARLTSNPWRRISRKKLRTASRRELTREELCTVCEKAEGELRVLFAVGVYTGMRLGDCATLRWAEVDLGRNVIRRVPSKTAANGRQVCIPIHAVLRSMLEEIPRDDQEEFVMPHMASTYARADWQVCRWVQGHFRSCGIRLHGMGDKGHDRIRAHVAVGFHSLRHSFVSLCREANAPLAVVESIVGHSNPAMTRLYSHVSEEAAGAAVAALPSFGNTGVESKRSDRLEEVLRLLPQLNHKALRAVQDAARDLLQA